MNVVLLLRAGSVSLAIRIAGVALALASAMVMVRLLGGADFGEYSFVFTIVTLVAIPAQLGLPSLVIRETARAAQMQKPSQILQVWHWSHQVVATMSAVCIAFILVLTWIFPAGPTSHHTVWWALPLVPLIALGNIRGAALRGLGKTNLGQLPEMFLRPLLFLLSIALAYFLLGPGGTGAAGVIKLQVASALAAFIIGGYWLIRSRPDTSPAGAVSAEQHRRWLWATITLGLSSGLQTISGNADILMLGFMRNTAEVGIYKIATTIGALASFVLASLSVVVMPRVVALLQADDTSGVQVLVRRTAQFSFASALLCLMIVLPAGQPLLHLLFGPEFISAYPSLVVLLIGHTICAFFGPLTLLLNMAGQEKEVLRGLAVGAVVNLLVNLALVPSLGGFGAAIATTTSFVVWNLWLFIRARKKLGIVCSAIGLKK